jgi:hypothetical protein
MERIPCSGVGVSVGEDEDEDEDEFVPEERKGCVR